MAGETNLLAMAEISPFFAIDAEQLLDAGLPGQAIELCKLGIEIYPDYPSAYIILAKSYGLLNRYDEANQILENSKDLFPFNRALQKFISDFNPHKPAKSDDSDVVGGRIDYTEIESDFELPEIDLGKIPSIAETQDLLPQSDDIASYSSSHSKKSRLTEFSDRKYFLKKIVGISRFVNEGSLISASNLSIIPGLIFSPFRNNTKLPELRDYTKRLFNFPNPDEAFCKDNSGMKSSDVKEMKDTELPADDDYPEPNRGYPTSMMTETLAKIYEAQGAYSAAISAYLLLIKQYPDKELYYNSKIKELQSKL